MIHFERRGDHEYVMIETVDAVVFDEVVEGIPECGLDPRLTKNRETVGVFTEALDGWTFEPDADAILSPEHAKALTTAFYTLKLGRSLEEVTL